MLYAGLYQLKCGVWPVRLEVVPLQGAPVSVPCNEEEAQRLLAAAVAILRDTNQRIADVKNNRRQLTELASPCPRNCRLCLFRPACQAYWLARTQEPQTQWPADVRGTVCETTHLRNGKMCLRIAQSDQPLPSCITVRNLTASIVRHPLINAAHTGIRVALYGLEHNYRSGDYAETLNTAFFVGPSESR